MPAYGWELHQSPHRHYKRQKDDGDWTWNGRDRARIASVTDVLNAKESLTPWAVNNAIVAAEQAAVNWLGAAPLLAGSVVNFRTMAELTGLMPDSIRDDKGAIGTAAHGYFGARLLGEPLHDELGNAHEALRVPYGYRVAIDRFLDETQPYPTRDEHGYRVERAVGSHELAVAGTYDAQLFDIGGATHRFDLKSSNSIQPKHFAQVAMYEHLAQNVGEEPSDFCTLLHVAPTGAYHIYSIDVCGADYNRALDVFMAHLTIHRGVPKLAKLLKITEEDDA